MKFKNTFEKYEFIERFYLLLDELVTIKDDDVLYKQLTETFGEHLPKSIVIFDRKNNENAFRSRFKHICDISLFDDAYVLSDNIVNSYITVIELYSENSIKDKLLNIEFKIENIPSEVISGELLICRIIEIDNQYFILGDYIPLTFLHAEALIDEFTKLHNPDSKTLDAASVKYLSYDLVMFYFLTSFDQTYLTNDIDIFENGAIATLMFNKPELSLFVHMFSYGSEQFFNFLELLSIFYLNSLLPSNKNFSSFKRINFYDEFYKLANLGAFKNQTEFLFVIDAITDLYKFLSQYDEKYKEALQALKDVKKHIFEIIPLLKNSLQGFYYDESLLDIVPTTAPVLDDLDVIRDTIAADNIYESSKNLSLTGKSIRTLADALKINPTKKVTSLSTYHFPYIDFLYRFIRAKGLIDVFGEISLTHRFDEFENLDDEEILALLYTSLFNNEFLNFIYPPIKVKELLNKLQELFYSLTNTSIKLDNLSTEQLHYLDFFSRLGLVTMDEVATISFVGKNIIQYYSLPTQNIINLNNYR